MTKKEEDKLNIWERTVLRIFFRRRTNTEINQLYRNYQLGMVGRYDYDANKQMDKNDNDGGVELRREL